MNCCDGHGAATIGKKQFRQLHRRTHLTMARLLAIVYILAIVSSAFGVTIKVEPKSEECFHEDLEQGVEFEVLWNVIDGGLLDVEYKVRS
jgi:hypothetical protein